MREEVVLKSIVDPDFGVLELVETTMQASVDGGPMHQLVYRTWCSSGHAEGHSVLLSNEADPPVVAEDLRSAFRSILEDEATFFARIAKSQLQPAIAWARDGELGPHVDEASFAKLLRFAGFTIDPGRLTVLLEESAGIVAGHAIEVRIENGEIREVGLAG
jgi:hypothetical protein